MRFHEKPKRGAKAYVGSQLTDHWKRLLRAKDSCTNMACVGRMPTRRPNRMKDGGKRKQRAGKYRFGDLTIGFKISWCIH